MTTVPGTTPVTVPETSTEATPGSELVHVPPGVASLSEVVSPAQISKSPVILAGSAFTEIILERKQPVESVYVIRVVPALIPKRPPADEIVPTAGVLLLHAPPKGAEEYNTVAPTHMAGGPEIADGNGYTVTSMTEKQPVLSV